MKRNNVVVVLGMHRSGTSAVTRALEVIGVDLGGHLMAGLKGVNDKGFFEDVGLVNINIKAMQALGAEWHSLKTLQMPETSDDNWDEVQRAAEGFLKMRTREYKGFGIKDPRLCRLLPMWEQAFRRSDKSAFGVVAIRDPISVAKSLERRDGFPYVKSYYLWLRHVVESVANSDWMKHRLVIDYDELMADPEHYIERMAAHFGFRVDRSDLRSYQNEFLDKNLRHFSASETSEGPWVPELVSKTYDLLRRTAVGELEMDSEQFRSEFAEIRHQYEELIPLLDYCDELEEGASSQAPYVPGQDRNISLGAGQSMKLEIGASSELVARSENSGERIQRWLSERLPSIGERAWVDRLAAGEEALPALAMVVLCDREGSVETTVNSFFHACPPGLDPSVYLLGAEQDPSLNGALDGPVTYYGSGDGGLPWLLNELCSDCEAEWLLLVRPGSSFTESGLQRVMIELSGAGGIAGVFADELIQTPDGEIGTGFRPDFNLDLLLSNPSALSRNWFFRRESVIECGGIPDYDRAFELGMILRLVEAQGLGCIGHAAEPMLLDSLAASDVDEAPSVIEQHLKSRGYEAPAVEAGPEGFMRVRYGHQDTPLVSIVIASRDNIHMLQRCVETLLEKTSYPNFELVLVDNQSQTDAARQWLNGLQELGLNQVRVIQWEGAFSKALMQNFGAGQAKGEYLVFLDDNSAVATADWLENLLNHAQRPEVGVVGAKVLTPDSEVLDGGVVLGLQGPGTPAFQGASLAATGYMGRLQADQDVSAIAEHCWMVSKALFEAVGGLDGDALSGRRSTIDFCLKVGSQGGLTVWTPHALIMATKESDPESGSDGDEQPTLDEAVIREEDALYGRWLNWIGNDPAYNRNMSLHGSGFELEARPARVPLPLDLPEEAPSVLAHNADRWGCGYYRIIQPFEAMKRERLINGWRTPYRLSLPEVARLKPDVVVLQRQLTEFQINEMRRTKQFTDCFTVFELDDYLPNLPLKSIHREHVPKDVVKSLRKALQWVDKFTVSTAPLAEALSSMHSEIEVVENCLPLEWWGDLSNVEQEGKSDKPRVGWAGGSGHRGDLELVADVVAELSDEVHWVFFGMCPPNLRPYVSEVHDGVDIDKYPEKLASLNLDLAIAPLEDNLFNRCKSNLRLLEYGICGYPVVCSDVAPYQTHDMPVTRVRNRFKEWVDAIRDHLSSPDALRKQAQALQTRVRSDWMLEGENVKRWLDAWRH